MPDHRAMVAVAGLLLASPARAAPPPSQAERGKQIYFDGVSPTGSDITAEVLGDATPVPGSALACAGCHGDDGRGRPEGAVVPTDIRWSMLAKASGRSTWRRRGRPPYDERTLARAVESGRDPAGVPLDPMMPRYTMSRADMDSLVAFLKRLEHLRVPGVLPARIRIGTVLPTSGRLRESGEALRDLLQAWFAELGTAGGIHGRAVELAVAGYDSDREDGLRAARGLLAAGDVFALVAPFTPGAERELARLARDQALPIVGPLAGEGGTPEHLVFRVLSGVREQARILADHAARLGLADASAAIVHGPGEPLADAAAAARAQLGSHGGGRAEVRALEAGQPLGPLATELSARGVQVVLFLGGDDELAGFGRAARDLDWAPVLLVPGSLAAHAALELPPAFDGKVFLAFPTVPGDLAPAAAGRLTRLRQRAHVPERHLAAQVEACAAAAILVEGLKRTGRTVRRERFVEQLEGLYEFRTDLVPPVTFGPSRRVGALGGYVVRADLQAGSFRPVGRWSRLD